MSGRLAGKVALVSGAGRGIGTEIARLFAAQGASVILTDVRDSEGEKVAATIAEAGGSTLYRHLDVRSRSDWDAARDEGERRFGPVDVLVSNAFRMSMPALADLTDDEWTGSLEVNLTGGFHGIRSVLPGMRDRGRGSIVVISATNGNEVALPVNAAYQAAKAALSSLVRHVAVAYGHEGVRANAVHPGGTRTRMLEEEGYLGAAEVMAAGFPIPRLAEPSEVAQAALFLASDDSSYVTGASLVVDGGSSVGVSTPEEEKTS
jgi:NAD(P)-dependent dehydrogenase (short-subunit alcohol dehydrogenase family)